MIAVTRHGACFRIDVGKNNNCGYPMKSLRARLWSLLAFCFLSASVNGAPIYYEAESLGGNSWRYDYSVGSDDPSSPVYEFTIHFDLGLYSNLRLASAPSGWDPLAIQPDANLPADGFYDALALGDPISYGDLLSGFSIVFEFLGVGAPGSQRYDIVDPQTFATLSSGLTQRSPSTMPVPEPGASILLLLALGMCVVSRTVLPRRQAAIDA